MVFFRFRTVCKPIVSRFFPGYFFSFAVILVSCNNVSEKKPEIKIAKTVSANYVKTGDSNFVKHQDTVYYQGKYFTGYRFSLYNNGDTAFIESYFNGVDEGFQKKWYPNKQMAEERFYINGKKEGTHRGWWPDGKPKFFFSAVNDENEGEFMEWNSSGLLCKKFHYVNGQEEGSQRLWWDNGTIRANYVIRNGKKYGFIGLKTCVNPYDSIVKK
jgi:antitoxin component YwqK of YwqJK toxin-antitoxin module